MKKFYLVIVALCLSVVAHGQLRPPVQSDTLVVKSVKYNYSDIRKENWPCNIIVKSTTSFQFGDQVVNIKDAREGLYDSGVGIQHEKLHLQHISIPMPMHLHSSKELLHMYLNCIDWKHVGILRLWDEVLHLGDKERNAQSCSSLSWLTFS